MRGSLALPCATPMNSAPKPSFVISFGPSISTFTPSVAQRLAALGHLHGVEHVGRLADQVARQVHALGHRQQRLPFGLGARRRPAASTVSAEFRLVLRLFLGAVAVEPIAAQRRTERDSGGRDGLSAGGGKGGLPAPRASATAAARRLLRRRMA